MEHIWTMLMHKILQNHLLCAFVANLKIGTIYALYPEGFCDKNLAIRKVFAFCDSVGGLVGGCGAQAVSLKTPIYFIIYKRGQLKNTLYMTGDFSFLQDNPQKIVAVPGWLACLKVLCLSSELLITFVFSTCFSP